MKGPITEPNVYKKHIRDLGFNNEDEYLQWCSNNGFESKIKKNKIQRKAEALKLKENKHNKSLKESTQKFNSASNFIPHKHPDKDLVAFFEFLKKKTKLINSKSSDFNRWPYTVGLQTLWHYNGYWIRDYNDWKPTSKNARKQFSSLVRFLLTEYEIPLFMDEAWFVQPVSNDKKELSYNKTRQITWFIDLCAGKNIRKLDGLPIELNKRQAHIFSQAPSHYTIDDAFRYGQILGLGGDERLVKYVINKLPVVHSYNYRETRNEFWEPLIRIFINNPMMDPHIFGEIVDYVEAEKVENPNFSFKHRTADGLLRRSEEWHNQIQKTQGRNFVDWDPNPEIRPYEAEEGMVGKSSHKIWKIEQLMNSKELSAEGKAMRHCVRSYVSSCKAGRCSIWSLKNMEDRCVTIEVNKRLTIVQAKGLANRSPNAVERRVIEKWASKNNLGIRI